MKVYGSVVVVSAGIVKAYRGVWRWYAASPGTGERCSPVSGLLCTPLPEGMLHTAMRPVVNI